jgi:hypothetical protein
MPLASAVSRYHQNPALQDAQWFHPHIGPIQGDDLRATNKPVQQSYLMRLIVRSASNRLLNRQYCR